MFAASTLSETKIVVCDEGIHGARVALLLRWAVQPSAQFSMFQRVSRWSLPSGNVTPLEDHSVH